MRLTRSTVAKLALPPGRSEAIYFDEALPGFGVRIRAGGKRTWIVQYRVGTKQRRVTLGNVEVLDPDKARLAARETLAKVQLGGDPQIERAETKARASVTVGAVVSRYLEDAAERQRARSLDATRRYLRVHWAPLKEIPIDRVHRATVAARLKEIAKENGPVAANRARQCLSAFFGWAMREGLTDLNPVAATNQAVEETSRERVLSDDELKAIWRTCRDDTFGRIVRLLILTGQRRDEVGGITRDEINLAIGVWALPAHRAKNSRPHEVPLSRHAMDIVSAVMSEHSRPSLFGNAGRGYSGWSTAKSAFYRRMKEAGSAIAAWRLHDIRRTVATRLADLGALPHIVEAVLNHVSGHKSGVAGVYNRAAYAKEKREVLDLWADHLQVLIAGLQPVARDN